MAGHDSGLFRRFYSCQVPLTGPATFASGWRRLGEAARAWPSSRAGSGSCTELGVLRAGLSSHWPYGCLTEPGIPGLHHIAWLRRPVGAEVCSLRPAVASESPENDMQNLAELEMQESGITPGTLSGGNEGGPRELNQARAQEPNASMLHV